MYPSERATQAFQRGFRDCRDHRPALHTIDNGTFYAHDYIEGWNSCFNTQYWDAVRENKSRDELRARAAVEAAGWYFDLFLFGGWTHEDVRDDDGDRIVYDSPADIIRGFDLEVA